MLSAAIRARSAFVRCRRPLGPSSRVVSEDVVDFFTALVV
jgi:hypothetical protein